MNGFDSVGDVMLALALTVPRIAAAFLVLPLMSSETVPALVRNSFYVSLAIIALPVAMSAAPMGAMGAGTWPLVILKELLIGTLLGFTFGSVFWALGTAGGMIDTQIGANFSNVVDPIQGHQTSLTGQLFSQLAAWLFMASGAFLVFLDILISSYQLWPVQNVLPALNPAGAGFMIGQLSYLMSTALLFAAPAMVVMSIVDFSFGLVNRYAQQLNVFSLTLPIKAWLAQWVILLTLGLIVEVVLRKLFQNRELIEVFKRLLPAP